MLLWPEKLKNYNKTQHQAGVALSVGNPEEKGKIKKKKREV